MKKSSGRRKRWTKSITFLSPLNLVDWWRNAAFSLCHLNNAFRARGGGRWDRKSSIAIIEAPAPGHRECFRILIYSIASKAADDSVDTEEA